MLLPRIYRRTRKRGSPNVRASDTSNKAEQRRTVMDAKYNYIIDSMKWRIALNLAGFALWLATAIVLLHLAA